MDYKLKYIKYKAKYLEFKNKLYLNQSGGSNKKLGSSNEKPELYLFKAEWCGHCKAFAPVWEELQKKSYLKDRVEFITMDATENKTECDEWKINGFPTIILKKGYKATEYDGERSIDKIIDFYKKAY